MRGEDSANFFRLVASIEWLLWIIYGYRIIYGYKDMTSSPSRTINHPRHFQLSCGLTEFPMDILDLADSLEILDLSNNQLRTLPDEFAQLRHLKIAFFTNNAFNEVPAVLAACPQLSMVSFKGNGLCRVGEGCLPPALRWLILTDNQIEKLPANIGQFTRLQKLMLAGNQLRSLPSSLTQCRNLELIRLSANCLEELPDWLFTLPRLAWLAYAGNPFCNPVGDQGDTSALIGEGGEEEGRSLPAFDWATVQIGDILGQGASGITYKGVLQYPGATVSSSSSSESLPSHPQEVAVKLFKGNVTSDGIPLDEMRAYVAAGHHPHLVNVLGTIKNHPDGKQGLVFSLIPPDYANLGCPPNFATCTRDTFEPHTSFSLSIVQHIAQGMASAADHLHTRNIMHGDLYAHNVLVNPSGNSILGDFGAASFYPPTSLPGKYPTGHSLEQLEVRAFGCLLEDLLNHCDGLPSTASQHDSIQDDPVAPITFEALRQLQQVCLHPDPALRPGFTAICEFLEQPHPNHPLLMTLLNR